MAKSKIERIAEQSLELYCASRGFGRTEKNNH